MTERPRVAVVGAVNVDLVVQLQRLPAAGETMTDGTFSQHQGGKGGNQAVGAARALGDSGDVVMICSVGRDDLGRQAIDALRAEGSTLEPAEPLSDRPTGVALILVDQNGENEIAVALGANAALEPQTVREALDRSTPSVVLASLEVPDAAVAAAADWCRQRAVAFVLNPAPMNAPLVRDLQDRIAYLIPNQHEREQLGDASAGMVVIETRGSDGVIIHGADGDEQLPASVVEAVDTTGAGDCFSGVFAVPALEAPNRIILTAARNDRPSFGCGHEDRFTYFDGCMLKVWPDSQTWQALFKATDACVRRKCDVHFLSDKRHRTDETSRPTSRK